MPAGSELSFVVRGCDSGVREDGRDCGEWRPATVHTDVILSAIGSSRVQLGGTDVLVGIKVPMRCTICHAVSALPRLSADLNTVHKITAPLVRFCGLQLRLMYLRSVMHADRFAFCTAACSSIWVRLTRASLTLEGCSSRWSVRRA